MFLEPQTRSDICTMLRITVRQLQSIEKMFIQNKDAYDIVIQLRAAQGGISKLSFLMNDAFLMDINLFLHTPRKSVV